MPTKISYLNHPPLKGELWSPTTGCAGKGCATKETCWARAMVKRFPKLHGFFNQIGEPKVPSPVPFPFGDVHFHPDRLDQPLHWKKPRRIGVCFMGDLYDEQVKEEWIDDIMAVVADKRCEQHEFFFLTKQSKRMAEILKDYVIYPNTWHGISCCTQPDLDRMGPWLLKIPGHRWISFEPMFSHIDVFKNMEPSSIGLVVIGCHSNPLRYPCQLGWIESVVEQCQEAGIPCYVKQIPLGNRCSRNPEEWPKHLRERREMP